MIKFEIYRENTDRGNGIAMFRDGTMIWAQERGIFGRNLDTGGFTNIMPGFRAFQPNDLIARARGGLYFTDPGPRPALP